MTDRQASCTTCGRPDRWGERYCAYCGHDLARDCSSCGTVNSEGNRFCIGCGTSLAPPPPSLIESGRYSLVRGKQRSPGP